MTLGTENPLEQQQRDRAPIAAQRAEAKLSRIPGRPAIQPLITAAQRARSLGQRVVWLQRAATAWAKPMEPLAACRKGCSHCCHIPLTISSVEATLIGVHTGRQPAKPSDPVRLDGLQDAGAVAVATQRLRQDSMLGTPCPFLADGACSIYDHRPIACRVLVNLDDDDLLCQHAPGFEASVPYADSRELSALATLAQASSPFADIREFFPADGAPA